jgi:protein O-mannosyl-transferase
VNRWRQAPLVDVAAVIGLMGLALASSLGGLGNGFVFDDEPIIAANPHIHDLHAILRVWASPYWPPELGGRLYRPVTMTAFATEWWAGHGSPFLFHAINIAVYAAVTAAVFALAARFLPAWAAWLAAALFAVHPVHVEVVANAVGQGELLAAVAVVTAVAWYVACRQRENGTVGARDVAGLTGLFLVGCLSKEHAAVLPLLLLAAELTIVGERRDRRALWPLAASLGVAFVAYLVVRAVVLHGVVGEIPAVEFRDASVWTRWWTMLAIAGQWLRLLMWPAHLAAIYSPPATPVLDGPTLAIVPALLCIPLAILVAARDRGIAFGLAWTGICLLPTSNVVVPTGVFLSERTLFLPSVGVVLAIGAGVVAIGLPRRIAMVTAAVFIAMGLVRSVARQAVWHDDDRFFAQAVSDEPRSYAAHYQLARQHLAAGQWDAAMREAERAQQLYGGDPELAGVLGRAYAREGRCEDAVPLLRQAVAQSPTRPFPRARLARCLEQLGDRQ